MLNRIVKYTQNRWKTIKPNDVVTVKDKLGNETTGRIKTYSPDKITLEVIQYASFDAKKVSMEKVN